MYEEIKAARGGSALNGSCNKKVLRCPIYNFINDGSQSLNMS